MSPEFRSRLDQSVLRVLVNYYNDQERELATILNGIHKGYLPTTVSIHGPSGTGKTLTTRRICQEFASRHADVAPREGN